MAEGGLVVVIGAGMAGASAAAEIASDRPVLLLEREDQPGYHTTGRSAALYTENYGPPSIRALTAGSRDGFAGALSPRGAMFVARADDPASLAGLAAIRGAARGLERLTVAAAVALVPVLRATRLADAVLEADACDIDVHALHQTFLRRARARGASLRCGAEVVGIDRARGGWRLHLADGERVTAATIVNAAGAWADQVAGMAGVVPVGLQPRRRTAALVEVRTSEGRRPDPAAWPLVCEAGETVYFRPDAGRLMVSPADETPSPPCDARPEELDVALAIHRVQQIADIEVRRPLRTWAGLRTFAPDGGPVYGPDPGAEDFCWCAGQGGYGIQTAPAAGRLCAALLSGREAPDDLRNRGLDARQISAGRFAAA